MNSLIVPLAAITHEGVTVDVEVPVSILQPPVPTSTSSDLVDLGTCVIPDGMVHIQGTLSQEDKEYVFEGVVSGIFLHECDRCLDPVSTPFRQEVWMYFRQGAPMTIAEEAAVAGDAEDVDDDAEIVYGFAGHEIDLGFAIWEEIVLNAPTKFVCRENCAGLCPACGVNLNRETCGCGISHDAASGNEPVAGGTPGTGRKPMETKGLAGLADLFPDLKPTNSEE